MVFGTALAATTAGNELLLHPPTSHQREGKRLHLAEEHTHTPTASVLSTTLNAQKANFAAVNQAEPGNDFPDSHDFIRPKSNFLIQGLSQQHPAKPKSLVFSVTAPF